MRQVLVCVALLVSGQIFAGSTASGVTACWDSQLMADMVQVLSDASGATGTGIGATFWAGTLASEKADLQALLTNVQLYMGTVPAEALAMVYMAVAQEAGAATKSFPDYYSNNGYFSPTGQGVFAATPSGDHYLTAPWYSMMGNFLGNNNRIYVTQSAGRDGEEIATDPQDFFSLKRAKYAIQNQYVTQHLSPALLALGSTTSVSIPEATVKGQITPSVSLTATAAPQNLVMINSIINNTGIGFDVYQTSIAPGNQIATLDATQIHDVAFYGAALWQNGQNAPLIFVPNKKKIGGAPSIKGNNFRVSVQPDTYITNLAQNVSLSPSGDLATIQAGNYLCVEVIDEDLAPISSSLGATDSSWFVRTQYIYLNSFAATASSNATLAYVTLHIENNMTTPQYFLKNTNTGQLYNQDALTSSAYWVPNPIMPNFASIQSVQSLSTAFLPVVLPADIASATNASAVALQTWARFINIMYDAAATNYASVYDQATVDVQNLNQNLYVVIRPTTVVAAASNVTNMSGDLFGSQSDTIQVGSGSSMLYSGYGGIVGKTFVNNPASNATSASKGVATFNVNNNYDIPDYYQFMIYLYFTGQQAGNSWTFPAVVGSGTNQVTFNAMATTDLIANAFNQNCWPPLWCSFLTALSSAQGQNLSCAAKVQLAPGSTTQYQLVNESALGDTSNNTGLVGDNTQWGWLVNADFWTSAAGAGGLGLHDASGKTISFSANTLVTYLQSINQTGTTTIYMTPM